MSPMTRTDLLALLAAYTKAEGSRQQAATFRSLSSKDVTEYESADEYLAASAASFKAHNALLDGIFALDIPA